MIESEPLALLAPLAVVLLGALAAPLSTRATFLAAAFGGFLSAATALHTLMDGRIVQGQMTPLTPPAGLTLRIDPLSAIFLLMIGLLTIASSIYALGYADRRHGGVPGSAAAFSVFTAAMALVVLADSVFTFLFAWELMSLASYFLVMQDHEQADVRRAGQVYLVMTHLGAVFLTVPLFVLAAAAGSTAFDALRAAGPQLEASTRGLLFLLMLAGFAVKAGLVPVHVWLPRAHPAAPSHASALMSGVMIKTAVYGLLRFGVEFLGPGEVWWGALALVLGAVSAVLGVLYALMEADIKRLLAFSTVENAGIIFMGTGVAVIFSARGMAAPAALALSAALLHAFNHALFKGLLFLGAGAVQRAAHTRNSEHLGGLLRGMPRTSLFVLTGAAAIAALPPLNGFTGEWLTVQALLRLAGAAGGPLEATGVAVALGALALTGGLAAYCFVKFFGVVFLGVPRRPLPEPVNDAARAMLAGMGLLAALCVLSGLFPSVLLRLLQPVTAMLTGAAVQAPAGVLAAVPAPPSLPSGGIAPLGVLALIAGLGALGLLAARLLGGPGGRRIVPPWGCGVELEPRMQYGSATLAKPIRIIFAALLRPVRYVDRDFAQAPYFVRGVRYEAALEPVVNRYLYRLPVGALISAAKVIRVFQSGGLRLYLAYMLATLVAVLLLTR